MLIGIVLNGDRLGEPLLVATSDDEDDIRAVNLRGEQAQRDDPKDSRPRLAEALVALVSALVLVPNVDARAEGGELASERLDGGKDEAEAHDGWSPFEAVAEESDKGQLLRCRLEQPSLAGECEGRVLAGKGMVRASDQGAV